MKNNTKIILAIIIIVIVILVIILKLTNQASEPASISNKSSEWNREISKLIEEGCVTIQVDGDGNTCSFVEEYNSFMHCTEMLTTKPWSLPKCVGYKE